MARRGSIAAKAVAVVGPDDGGSMSSRPSADTVHDTGPRANGFVFEGTDDAAVASCVDDALDAWWMDRDRFEELRARGMSDDVSWGASADSYLAFYAGEVGE